MFLYVLTSLSGSRITAVLPDSQYCGTVIQFFTHSFTDTVRFGTDKRTELHWAPYKGTEGRQSELLRIYGSAMFLTTWLQEIAGVAVEVTFRQRCRDNSPLNYDRLFWVLLLELPLGLMACSNSELLFFSERYESITFGRTPLDGDQHVARPVSTQDNTTQKHKNMPRMGFKPTIPVTKTWTARKRTISYFI
jgi:hypothetical protein